MATEAIPEPIPDRTDVTKAKRLVFLDRIAHTGMMLAKMDRQIRRAERIEKFAATGDTKDLDAPAGEVDDMGVNIGNETHNHYQVTETPAKESTVTQVATKAAGIVPSLLVGASLLGGGAGVGYIINDIVNKQPAAVAQAPASDTDTDTDTITDVTFPE